jgi:aminoglycoside phosphotransferase (APT) family kinase protein
MTRNLEDLAQRLRAHLVEGGRVTQVTVLSGGHSNETYLVHGIDRILRMPPSATPLLDHALDVRRQFELFAALRGRPGAPPVPGLDYFCADTEVLGAPFYLMERVDGVAGVHWEASDLFRLATPEVRSGLCRDFMVMVANFPGIGPLDVLGPIKRNAEELQRWRHMVRDLHLPRFSTLMDKLEASAPRELPAGLVHGDYIFANMLWKDGRMAAALDWELAFNGDPRWDLAYLLAQFDGPGGEGLPGFDMPGIWQRDAIIRFWEETTGLSADGLLWFEAAGKAKGAAILYFGQHLWDTGLSDDKRLSAWGDFGDRVLEKAEKGFSLLRS